MFTVNRDEAVRLRETRPKATRQDLETLAGVDRDRSAPKARLGEPARSWQHWVREVALEPEEGIVLPATWLYPVDENRLGDAVLYFDDRGRWTDLRKQGRAAAWAGFLGAGQERQLLTVDLRGWGDTMPAELPYDIAGWGGRDRWIAYVSAALGDSIMAMRIRDGLAAFRWLKAQHGTERIVVGGHGLGAIVALYVAALAGDVAGVFCDEMPVSIESLVAGAEVSWPPDVFIPEIVMHFDLPDLVGMVAGPVLVAAPLDARRQPLDPESAKKTYENALVNNSQCTLQRVSSPAEFMGHVFGE